MSVAGYSWLHAIANPPGLGSAGLLLPQVQLIYQSLIFLFPLFDIYRLDLIELRF